MEIKLLDMKKFLQVSYSPQKVTSTIRHFILVALLAISFTIVFTLWKDVDFVRSLAEFVLLPFHDPNLNIAIVFVYLILYSECLLIFVSLCGKVLSWWNHLGTGKSSTNGESVTFTGETATAWVLMKLCFKIILLLIALMIVVVAPSIMTTFTIGLLPIATLSWRGYSLYKMNKLNKEVAGLERPVCEAALPDENE